MKPRWFDAAKAAAAKSPSSPQMGAAIVKGGRLLSIGFNQRDKTHPRANTWSRCIHAELHAILGLTKDQMDGADIYVYREIKSGTKAMARPCPSCWALLNSVGIRRVYYTVPDGVARENIG